MTTPSGKVIAYSFNSQGQIAGITLDGNPLLSGAIYYPFGGIQQFSFANGQVYKREYDLDGRIKNVTLGPDTDLIPDPNLTVGYDNLDRLTSATNPAKPALGYTYDGVGNRLTQTTGTSTTTYTYPGTSHKLSGLSGAQTKSFGYDAAGNMITVGSLAFTYDGRGRAKQSGTASNLINGLGQRVAKTVSGNPTYFAYDEAGKLIGEYDASGAMIQETVWLSDQPVATLKPKVGGGYDTFAIWSDNLNTPRAISRPIDNQVVWRWENTEPFGNNAANENPAGLGAFAYNLRFPGQYYDQETATNYNYFRDYDPSTGRYVQSDPIGLDGGINTFTYTMSRPLVAFDPTGEDWITDIKLLIGLGRAANTAKQTGESRANAIDEILKCEKGSKCDVSKLKGQDADREFVQGAAKSVRQAVQVQVSGANQTLKQIGKASQAPGEYCPPSPSDPKTPPRNPIFPKDDKEKFYDPGYGR